MEIFVTCHSPAQQERRHPRAPLGLEVEPGKLFLLELFHPSVFITEESLIVFKKGSVLFHALDFLMF